jgi:hypothetical protein
MVSLLALAGKLWPSNVQARRRRIYVYIYMCVRPGGGCVCGEAQEEGGRGEGPNW